MWPQLILAQIAKKLLHFYLLSWFYFVIRRWAGQTMLLLVELGMPKWATTAWTKSLGPAFYLKAWIMVLWRSKLWVTGKYMIAHAGMCELQRLRNGKRRSSRTRRGKKRQTSRWAHLKCLFILCYPHLITADGPAPRWQVRAYRIVYVGNQSSAYAVCLSQITASQILISFCACTVSKFWNVSLNCCMRTICRSCNSVLFEILIYILSSAPYILIISIEYLPNYVRFRFMCGWEGVTETGS